MAYFDNAATTYPKPDCVYDFMNQFYRNVGGSAGRGQYALSQNVSSLISDTRNRIKNLLHCPAKQVIFTPSATIALNIIIQGVVKRGAKNIYISPFEHNAVTRTLHGLEKAYKISVQQLTVSDELEYDFNKIKYQFEAQKPDLVIVSHASNVIGLISPVVDIFTLAKKYGSITLADMAQTAGLVDCNIGLEVFDFAVFAGHKTLLGPTGISGFVMKPDAKLDPILFGGTGVDSANQDMPENLPERFEMGTLNTCGIAGLNAALRWISEQTVESLYQSEIQNRARLIKLLKQYDFINIIGNYAERQYVGIVSCNITGISSDSAGLIFSEQGISVRTGLHCAPAAHQFLDTFPSGTIRFSVNHFTNDDDFTELEKALDFIESEL